MTVKECAYAKVNLFLDVVARRDDGFHDIKSVMHSVSLSDYLTISAENSLETSVILTTNIPNLSVGEDNLICRAARSYLTCFGINAEVNINLEKHIPIGAGLGGGSTDAAATLRGLRRIFGLGSTEELLRICESLGSDVPFCFIGGTAVCTGRGERLEKCQSHDYHFVIAIGEERVSTPKAYAALDKKYMNFASDGYTAREDVSALYNIFESVTDIDDVRNIKEILTKNGAESVLMSGSGPSVFGIFESETKAIVACDALKSAFYTAFVARSKGEENL